MKPSSSRVLVGAGLLVLLSVLDLISPVIVPAPPEATPFVDLVSVGFGLLSLAGLALWWFRGGRAGPWVATVVRVISGLLGLPALTRGEDNPAGPVVVIGFAAVTAVAVVLVAPAPGRSRARTAAA